MRLERHATMVIIAMNVGIFLYSYWLSKNRPFYDYNRFVREYSLSLDGLRAGAWWQVLSFQFLHGGWVHLILNLLLLHSLGPLLETTLGRWRFVLLYLISGGVGGLVHLLGAWSSPRFFGHPVVGASAGICGVLAALAALYAEEEVRVYLFFVLPITLRAKFLLLIVGLVSVAGVLLPPDLWRVPWTHWHLPLSNVAHLAHLGGFVGGLWCVNMFDARPLEPEDEPPKDGKNPR